VICYVELRAEVIDGIGIKRKSLTIIFATFCGGCARNLTSVPSATVANDLNIGELPCPPYWVGTAEALPLMSSGSNNVKFYVQHFKDNVLIGGLLRLLLHIKNHLPQYEKCVAPHLVYLGR
jgi:hypothetical protein